jgi:hypothetical protein
MSAKGELVYVVAESSDENYVKIGFTGRFKSRLAALQSGNPRWLITICTFGPIHKAGNAEMLERDLHKKFDDKRVRGEWFHKSVLEEFSALTKVGSIKFVGANGKFDSVPIVVYGSTDEPVIPSVMASDPWR